jgi:hypothetical protein
VLLHVTRIDTPLLAECSADCISRYVEARIAPACPTP